MPLRTLPLRTMRLRPLRFVLLLSGLVAPPAAVAATIVDEIPVNLYTAVKVDAAVRAAALRTAADVLAPTGAAIRWHVCSDPGACATTPQPGALILRIVQAPPAPLRRTPAARLHTSAGLPLGDAFVDVGQSAGVLATVYLDRVARLAREAGGDLGVLLGYAIAHELGHLLMGSKAHAAEGLMRPLWAGHEIKRGHARDWSFAEAEAAAIRTRLEAGRIADHVLRGVR